MTYILSRSVRIGAGSATLVESQIAVADLLAHGGELDFLVFDCLAEGVMGVLGRQKASGEAGYVADWIDVQVGPHLERIAERGIRMVSNAGGLDPRGAAQALRIKAGQFGLKLKIAWVEGDDLTTRADPLLSAHGRDMFDGRLLQREVAGADRLLSLCAYTGAFPIAAALDAGADVVITGRAVDSATTLGCLVHAFGWRAEDFDLLAAGTLAGHLIECSTQVTGGTFTDWEDVPDWANIGYPIAECFPDGRTILTKTAGSGGLLSRGTVAEQLLYEVSDPQHYAVPDVVCDFTNVSITQSGPDEVVVGGACGLGRPECLKATITWDRGWRGSILFPIIGLQAADKARRTAREGFVRISHLLARRKLPPLEKEHCDVVGGEEAGASTAICRMVADHATMGGVQCFLREQVSILTNMAVGISAPLCTTVRPLTRIGAFLLPRDAVEMSVYLDGQPVPYREPAAPVGLPGVPPQAPMAPVPIENTIDVPLIELAWARSGDKGDLFNVGVIARDPRWLPYIYHALDPVAIGELYARRLQLGRPLKVERYPVPGFDALNLVVHGALGGGMMAGAGIDPAAKGMAQLLLARPIAIPARLAPGVLHPFDENAQ